MATFGQWFLAQAGRGDQVGYAARAWRDAKRKPRASAPQTITNFLLADPDQVPELGKDEIEATMAAAVGQYHEGSYHAGPAVPAPRLDLPRAPLAAVQPPMGPAEREYAAGLAAVPDSPVSAAQEPAEGAFTPDMAVGAMISGRSLFRQFDERLAGIQELITDGDTRLAAAVERTDKRVADLHELYFAFLQAVQPLLELAAELKASDDKIGSMRADAEAGDAPQSLSDQLGWFDADLADSRPPVGTPAQQAARDVAQRNGWLPAQEFEAPGGGLPDWAGGLCEAHCREDRCAYGCSCPGHQPDGTHVTQTRLAERDLAQEHYDRGSPMPGSEVRSLYGSHVVPEPTQAQWQVWHEAGE